MKEKIMKVMLVAVMIVALSFSIINFFPTTVAAEEFDGTKNFMDPNNPDYYKCSGSPADCYISGKGGDGVPEV